MICVKILIFLILHPLLFLGETQRLICVIEGVDAANTSPVFLFPRGDNYGVLTNSQLPPAPGPEMSP